ncbi:MAG: deaminase [Parcubacteria group bacterium]
MKKNTIVAYVPVLHRGYIEFFKKYAGGTLLIPDKTIISAIEYLKRDMRALENEEISSSIRSLGILDEIKNADINDIIAESRKGPIIMPKEDISSEIAKLLPTETNIVFDSVFLRWNKFNVLQEEPVFWDKEITSENFDSSVLKTAFREKELSSDWWRQIGAVAFRDGNILLAAHNHHLPTELEPYYSGDPRTPFNAGEHIELSSSIHAEAALIAEAAKKGISLAGAEVFVSTFPCPPCANLLSQAGIKTLYVTEGYSRLDAKRIFAENGIGIVKVKKDPV